jgi:integrase/recombinase XerD
VTTLALETQLQGYLEHLTIERGVAANTLSSYRRDLRRYSKHLSDRGIHDLAKVGEVDVTEFLVALRRGDPDSGATALSAVSAARALIAVRGLHRFAAAEGLAELDVARAVRPPTPGRRLPKSLTIDQVLALPEGAGGESPADGPLTLRNRALLELLYSTGSRISEAVGLDVDDIDTQARTVLLRGKGGKQRLVPVGRPAVHALDAYLVRGRTELARRPVVAAERMAGAAGCRPAGRHHVGSVAAHAAAFLCHPSAGGRRGCPGGSGAARSCLGDHDADLHAGHRACAARSVGRSPPPSPITARRPDQPR